MTGAGVRKGVIAAALTAALWVSCASPQAAGGPNADCFRVEDCQEGLVCIDKKCSRNLSKIMGESPPMAGGGQGGAAAVGDGAPSEGGPSGGAPAPDGASASGGAPGSGGSAPVDAGSD